MAAKDYLPATKAAVLAAVATGMSMSKAAEYFGVDRGTIRRWKSDTPIPPPQAIPEVADDASVVVYAAPDASAKKRDEIAALLYDYMRDSIIALHVQVQLFADREWLAKQSAGELATLHGVTADKTARIISAYNAGRESDES